MTSSRSTSRWPLTALLVVSAAALVFGTSTAAATDWPDEARVLASTFGAGMGVFSIALSLRAARGDRTAWLALWYLPVFFVIHVAAFQAWVPDLPFLALSAGALVVLGRGARGAVTRT